MKGVNYKKVSRGKWLQLITGNPQQYIVLCDSYNGWEKFRGDDWIDLFEKLPNKIDELIDRCDKYDGWKDFRGYHWDRFLKISPQFFVDRCDKYKGWQYFDEYNWCEILVDNPNFISKCDEYNVWNKFKDIKYWMLLLQHYPNLIKKCSSDILEKFGSYEWSDLLAKYPYFYDEYKEYIDLNRFEGNNWTRLLSNQPEKFISYCNLNKGWEKISVDNWAYILSKMGYCIDIINKTNEYSIWERFDGFHWGQLLASNLLYISFCNHYNGWEKLKEKDWSSIFEKQSYYFKIEKNPSKYPVIAFMVDLSKYKENIPKKYHYLLNVYKSLENFDNFVSFLQNDIKDIEHFSIYINVILENLDYNEISEKINIDLLQFKFILNKLKNQHNIQQDNQRNIDILDFLIKVMKEKQQEKFLKKSTIPS